MATLTLIIALMLTAGSVFLTSVLATRYGINDESIFLEDDAHPLALAIRSE
jgi:hypothetical protein